MDIKPSDYASYHGKKAHVKIGSKSGIAVIYIFNGKMYFLQNFSSGSSTGITVAHSRGEYKEYYYSYVKDHSSTIIELYDENIEFEIGVLYEISGQNVQECITFAKNKFVGKDGEFSIDTNVFVKLHPFTKDVAYLFTSQYVNFFLQHKETKKIYYITTIDVQDGDCTLYGRNRFSVAYKNVNNYNVFTYNNPQILDCIEHVSNGFRIGEEIIERGRKIHVSDVRKVNDKSIIYKNITLPNLCITKELVDESTYNKYFTNKKNTNINTLREKSGQWYYSKCCDNVKNDGVIKLFMPSGYLETFGYSEEFFLKYVELVNTMMKGVGKIVVNKQQKVPHSNQDLCIDKDGWEIKIITSGSYSYFMLIIMRYFWMGQYKDFPRKVMEEYEQNEDFFQSLLKVGTSIDYASLDYNFVSYTTAYSVVKSKTLPEYLKSLEKWNRSSKFTNLITE